MTTPSEAHYSLILRCAGNTLALPLAQVVEVVLVVAPAAPLLRAPRYCLGAVDYHGQLVPLIDLAARLGLRAPRTVLDLPEGRIVMLQGRVGLVGYLVEEVLEVCEEPTEPLALTEQTLAPLGGLLRGMVRYRTGLVAPILTPGALLPVVAGERLRKALAELATARGPELPG